jgi:hypothetical protein
LLILTILASLFYINFSIFSLFEDSIELFKNIYFLSKDDKICDLSFSTEFYVLIIFSYGTPELNSFAFLSNAEIFSFL